MKKIIFTLSIVAVVAMAMPFGNKAFAQAGDLCGGTGGRGQIVSVGNDTFTMKRNDNGRNQIVHLANQATIETSSGNIPISDLKAGDEVTLVGGPNSDGSFVADTVLVCGGSQEAATEVTGTDRTTPTVVLNNEANYKKVSGTINTVTIVLVGLIWLGIILFLKLKKQKNIVYLLFFTIFYIYLYKVIDITLIQFQSLLLLQHFLPDLMLRGIQAGRTVNLVPLATLRLVDAKTMLLNVLMMMPFGFGLPFITNFRFKKVVMTGLYLSITIELLQFITGFISNTTFRIADINDVIFNTIGVAVGYILFAQFVLLFRRKSRAWKVPANPILRYIADRPQIDKQKL